MSMKTVSSGAENSLDFRIQQTTDADEKPLSLWHDVPLRVVADGEATGLFNFVCEIPKWTRKKYEIATDEDNNPIKQDEKKGVLREFKRGDLAFNYGCFPQTWEDPTHIHPDTGFKGDNDPLDVCEIGMLQLPTGSVTSVKVLGVLAMVDDGETDWKVIAISSADSWAPQINTIHDLEQKLPGTLHSIREWFRLYKVPDGKPENQFALDELFMNSEYALKVIDECEGSWRNLVTGGGGSIFEEDEKVVSLTKARRQSLVQTSASMRASMQAAAEQSKD